MENVFFVFCIQSLWWGLPASSAQAQAYSRTETISYSDNTAKWVLSQVSAVTSTVAFPASEACNGDVVQHTSYDPTFALPTQTRTFGNVQATFTYDTTSTVDSGQRGTLKTVKDGNSNVTNYADWYRGIAGYIQYADSTSVSSVVNNSGWITEAKDQNGFATNYSYNAMGRLTAVNYPGGDSTSWNSTIQMFQPIGAVENGIPAGYWRQTVTTGTGEKITYLDALWRPVLVREADTATSQSATFTHYSYDSAGRGAFASYPSSVNSATTVCAQLTARWVGQPW